MLILAALCSLISLSTSPQIMPEFISGYQFGGQGTSGTTPEGGMYFLWQRGLCRVFLHGGCASF